LDITALKRRPRGRAFILAAGGKKTFGLRAKTISHHRVDFTPVSLPLWGIPANVSMERRSNEKIKKGKRNGNPKKTQPRRPQRPHKTTQAEVKAATAEVKATQPRAN
jgi:hypothetical protein